MTDKGELTKLVIKAYTKPDYTGGVVDEFTVSFNPEEYSQVYDIEYDDKSGDGTTGSPMVFKRIKPQEYTLKFMIDGTGASGKKTKVPETIERFFKVTGYDGNIHRPRYLEILWGTLRSHCILLKADITYKLFKPDGTPLRAVINASFKENIDDRTRVAKANDSSPDLTHVRVVKEGDTLPAMAYAIYGDFTHYIEVARVNGLDDFRRLVPGQRIFFPPLEKTEDDG
ncbi:MAG: hypothetical protein GXO94_09280 [Nitrospirae bacterium]|nr:hypothetical protein [Nitrospirota bacterium]